MALNARGNVHALSSDDIEDDKRKRIVGDLLFTGKDGIVALNKVCRVAAFSLGFEAAAITIRNDEKTISVIGADHSIIDSFEVREIPQLSEALAKEPLFVDNFQDRFPDIFQIFEGVLTIQNFLACPIHVDDVDVAKLFLFNSLRPDPDSDYNKGLIQELSDVAGTIMSTQVMLKRHMRDVFMALENFTK